MAATRSVSSFVVVLPSGQSVQVDVEHGRTTEQIAETIARKAGLVIPSSHISQLYILSTGKKLEGTAKDLGHVFAAGNKIGLRIVPGSPFPSTVVSTKAKTSKLAILALSLGCILLAVAFIPNFIPHLAGPGPLELFIVSLLIVIFAHVALYRVKKRTGRLKGRGFAIAGLVLGYLGVVLAILNFQMAQMLSNASFAMLKPLERSKEHQRNMAETLGVPIGKTILISGSIKMGFVLIPAGEFTMGSPPMEDGRADHEGPQHQVKITKAFYMGVTEVTQAQYTMIMGTNPSFSKGLDLPVSEVSWSDAVEFCRKLSEKEGKNFRLPTEAEWEYACRAGTTTPSYTGNTISTSQASYDGDSVYSNGQKVIKYEKPVEVGRFAPNAFGLYNMHGNVLEWCSDWYDCNYYLSSPDEDPKGPSQGEYHVLRGGAYAVVADGCRSARRGYGPKPITENAFAGFRVVLEVDYRSSNRRSRQDSLFY